MRTSPLGTTSGTGVPTSQRARTHRRKACWSPVAPSSSWESRNQDRSLTPYGVPFRVVPQSQHTQNLSSRSMKVSRSPFPALSPCSRQPVLFLGVAGLEKVEERSHGEDLELA